MDTKQIEYILKIAEENNITHAARKLNLTQPALNQQLLRLERELGLQLFIREKNNCRPTEAGRIYLENAEKMLQIKQETYRILGDMAAVQKGALSVGFTPGRGSTMFSAVYPEFHRQYPNVVVMPQELSVRSQQALIAEGRMDIGFQTLCEGHKTQDAYVPILEEEVFLVIPSKHPLCQEPVCQCVPQTRQETAPSALPPELSIAALRHEPFVLMYKESTIRQMVDQIFKEAGFHPNVLFETASNATILSMIQNSLCCGLVPAYYLRNPLPGIACFSLPSHPTWEVTASYRRGTYLTKAGRCFIRLAAEFWQQG